MSEAERSVDEGSVVGVIYAFRLKSSAEFRYVGLTSATIGRRIRQHFRNAQSGRKTPFYDWLRKTPESEIEVETLQIVTTSVEDLGAAEIEWIAGLRNRGDRLLNISNGGLGPTGVIWTEEQREAARVRSTGRTIPPRFGAENPMFGQAHTAEQKARWSESRKGTFAGEDNPNFGKFGPDHPSFGHEVSAESRARLSQQKLGELNPNFGKSASAETRAKRSAAQKGVPKPSSARSAHTRYHTNKSISKIECKYCAEDANQSLAGSPRNEKK